VSPQQRSVRGVGLLAGYDEGSQGLKAKAEIACWAAALAVGFALSIDIDRSQAEAAATQPAARATGIPPIPPAQLALFHKYVGLLRPGVKSWIEGEAQAERAKPSLNLAELSAAIHSRFDQPQGSDAAAGALDALSEPDVAALSFLVILAMVQEGDSDLEQKTLQADAQPVACPPGTTAADVCTANLVLQNELDSENELSEMTSLQLQMLMDTRSKLLQTASDLEKSMSDTDMAILGNIKQ